MIVTYSINTYWSSRKESLDECTERVFSCLSSLKSCDMLFSQWYIQAFSKKKAHSPLNISYDDISNALNNGRNRGDFDNTIIDELGYSIGLWTGGKESESASVNIRCGIYSLFVPNVCILRLPYKEDITARIFNIHTLTCFMRSFIDYFNPDWSIVLTSDLDIIPGKINVGWITYYRSQYYTLPPLGNTFKTDKLQNGSIVTIMPDDQNNDMNLDYDLLYKLRAEFNS